MAKGMIHSASMFFGEQIEQLDHCCLNPSDDPESFGKQIKAAIKKVDTGEGVIILADLLGGTPFNQSIFTLNEKIDLIAGVNFALFLELLSARTFSEPDISSLVEIGKNGLVDAKTYLAKLNLLDDED